MSRWVQRWPHPRPFAELPAVLTELHRIADALAPALRDAVLAMFAHHVAPVDRSGLFHALRAGDRAGIERVLGLDRLGAGFAPVLEQALRTAIDQAGTAALGELVDAGVLPFRLASPRVLAYLEQRSLLLVTDLSAEARAVLRTHLAELYRQGLAPRRATTELLAVLGLTDRDAAAVARLRLTLTEAGLAATVIDRKVAEYAARLLRQRAETIALTETIGAANVGQRAAWEQAQAAGLLGGYEQRWLAASHSERTCPLCRSLHGTRAAIGGTYPGGFVGPPRHPRCRCVSELVRQP